MESSGKFIEVLTDNTFRVVEAVKSEDDNYLKQLQNAVGGWIECVPCSIKCGIDIFINEEGKLNGLPSNGAATKIAHIFADDIIVGNAILAQSDGEGNTTPLDVENVNAIKVKLVSFGCKEVKE